MKKTLPIMAHRVGWSQILHSDMNYVIWPSGVATDYSIEIVLGPRSRRKQWCICHRYVGCSSNLYPPMHAGPFPTLKAAKAAYKFLALG